MRVVAEGEALLSPSVTRRLIAEFTSRPSRGDASGRLIVVCVLAAPEGIEKFTTAHPDVPVFTAAIDSHLNEKGYIVPGLGDAGDRMYGTK